MPVIVVCSWKRRFSIRSIRYCMSFLDDTSGDPIDTFKKRFTYWGQRSRGGVGKSGQVVWPKASCGRNSGAAASNWFTSGLGFISATGACLGSARTLGGEEAGVYDIVFEWYGVVSSRLGQTDRCGLCFFSGSGYLPEKV
jgi:hypothetical protein